MNNKARSAEIEHPTAAGSRGDALTSADGAASARQLARLLRPYGVRSHNVRIGEVQRKGYEQAQFADAWRRYLSSETLESVPSVPGDDAGTGGTDRATSASRAQPSSATSETRSGAGLPDGHEWPDRRAESNEQAVLADAEFLVGAGLARWRDNESGTS